MNQIKTLLASMADMTDKTLSGPLVALYLDTLKNYPEKKVTDALLRLAKTKNKFPTLADILEILDPTEASELTKNENTASRILEAISKFGWVNQDRAHIWLGDEAWAIVQVFGGWSSLCSTVTVENKNIMFAQLRDIAGSGLSVKKQEAAKALPDTIKNLISNAIGELK